MNDKIWNMISVGMMGLICWLFYTVSTHATTLATHSAILEQRGIRLDAMDATNTRDHADIKMQLAEILRVLIAKK